MRERACERALSPTSLTRQVSDTSSDERFFPKVKKNHSKSKISSRFLCATAHCPQTARRSGKNNRFAPICATPIYAQPRTEGINDHFYTPRLLEIFQKLPAENILMKNLCSHCRKSFLSPTFFTKSRTERFLGLCLISDQKCRSQER